MSIVRYLSDANHKRLLSDFEFLFKKNGILEKSNGEMDVYLRDGYFNIYYKGNSLAKIVFAPNNSYRVSINKRFFLSSDLKRPYSKASQDQRIVDCITPSKSPKAQYEHFLLPSNLLHPFFQVKYINEYCSNIKKVHNSEELIFEQMLITDNITDNAADKTVIIDRQITEKGMSERMDLLALKRHCDNQYYFSVVEVKLGNNKELNDEVVSQIDGYVKRIIGNFPDYKDCYENVYEQKRSLDLPGWRSLPGKITIVQEETCGVEGKIVVFGYSGIAQTYIANLQSKYPNSPYTIRQITHKI